MRAAIGLALLVPFLAASPDSGAATILAFDNAADLFDAVSIESTNGFDAPGFVLGNPTTLDSIMYTSDLAQDSFSVTGITGVGAGRRLGAANIRKRTLEFTGSGEITAIGMSLYPSLSAANVYDVVVTTTGGETATALFPFNAPSTYVGFAVAGDTIEKVEIVPIANGTNSNVVNYNFDDVSWSRLPVRVPEPTGAALGLLSAWALATAGRPRTSHER